MTKVTKKEVVLSREAQIAVNALRRGNIEIEMNKGIASEIIKSIEAEQQYKYSSMEMQILKTLRGFVKQKEPWSKLLNKVLDEKAKERRQRCKKPLRKS